MKEITKLVQDERTYIESVAKQDKEIVRGALADKGDDTVLRLCIGMTGQQLPLRALSYVATALAVHEAYFPEAELQVVYPFQAAYLCNGIDEAVTAAVGEVLQTEPILQDAFSKAAGTRRGAFIDYVAAHVIMHDTNPSLQPLKPLTKHDFAEYDRGR